MISYELGPQQPVGRYQPSTTRFTSDFASWAPSIPRDLERKSLEDILTSERKSLEDILATEETRVLIQDYARSLLSASLVDFMVALLPFHNPTSPSVVVRCEDLAFIYDEFIDTGSYSHVWLSPPLARALEKALQPFDGQDRRSSISAARPAPDPDVAAPGQTVVDSALVALLDQAWQEVAAVVDEEILKPLRAEAAMTMSPIQEGAAGGV